MNKPAASTVRTPLKRPRHIPRCAFVTLLSLALITASAPAHASGLIRDAEIEAVLRDYSKDILQIANLPYVRIRLVGARSVNAYVLDGQNIFINAGTLMRADRPNEVIGVIAHEAGHIDGGHLAQFRSALDKANFASLTLQVLILAATAVGAATGSNVVGGLGAGGLLGAQEASRRVLLDYRRGAESSADQSAAYFLEATGQSARGMLDTFLALKIDQGDALKNVDPYILSHPMPRERLSLLRDLVQRSPYFEKRDDPARQIRHDMMRAKLYGFLDNPQSVFNRYPNSDQSLHARYARAIATYRSSGLRQFIPLIDALIAEQPDNPYFYEIKGQFLNTSSKPRSALPPLRKAVQLLPDEPLLRILLAQALIAQIQNSGKLDGGYLDEAIKQLKKASIKEKCYAKLYFYLGQAYGLKGNNPQGQLASAMQYQIEGNIKGAKRLAAAAIKTFTPQTREWLMAFDITTGQSKGC